MKEKPTKNKKLKKPTAKERKVNRRIKLRRKQIATSMYFLLWAIFTALSLFIVVLSAIMQRVIFTQTFKEQAEREISEEGKQIETLILEGGILRVNTADAAEEDNTRPITSAAVATQIGNIEIILKTI